MGRKPKKRPAPILRSPSGKIVPPHMADPRFAELVENKEADSEDRILGEKREQPVLRSWKKVGRPMPRVMITAMCILVPVILAPLVWFDSHSGMYYVPSGIMAFWAIGMCMQIEAYSYEYMVTPLGGLSRYRYFDPFGAWRLAPLIGVAGMIGFLIATVFIGPKALIGAGGGLMAALVLRNIKNPILSHHFLWKHVVKIKIDRSKNVIWLGCPMTNRDDVLDCHVLFCKKGTLDEIFSQIKPYLHKDVVIQDNQSIGGSYFKYTDEYVMVLRNR